MKPHIQTYNGLLEILDHEKLERLLFSNGSTYLKTPYVGDAQGEMCASPYKDKSLSKRAKNFCEQEGFCWYDSQVAALYPNEGEREYFGKASLKSLNSGRKINKSQPTAYHRLIDNLIAFLRLSADGRRDHMRSISAVCLIRRDSNHPIRQLAGPIQANLFTVRSKKQELHIGDVVGMYTGCVREELYEPDEDTSYSFGLTCYTPKTIPFIGYEPRIDALEFGNEMRYINSYNGYRHDDGTEVLDANVAGFQAWVMSEEQNIMVPAVIWIATSNIPPNTELLADYGPMYWYYRWKEETSRNLSHNDYMQD